MHLSFMKNERLDYKNDATPKVTGDLDTLKLQQQPLRNSNLLLVYTTKRFNKIKQISKIASLATLCNMVNTTLAITATSTANEKNSPKNQQPSTHSCQANISLLQPTTRYLSSTHGMLDGVNTH